MVDLVNVASKLQIAILMQGGELGLEIAYTIFGVRAPGAVNGHGITYGVDRGLFTTWMAQHPEFTDLIGEVTEDQLEYGMDPANTYGFELGLVPPEPPPTAPPVNVDVPYAQQEGGAVTVTMGNWQNMSTGTYAYQWQLDGVDAGTNSATYLITSGVDEGKTAACIVTATNELGSTAAPPSNSVVIA